MTKILIIGQGLAGTILGLHCIKYGLPFHIVDDSDRLACSRVAAGLINPITGTKMLKTWQADKIFPYLFRFYSEAEHTLKAHFFNVQDIYRPFPSISLQNDFSFLIEQKQYKNYLHSYTDRPRLEKYISNPYGGVSIRQAGWLDFVKLLEAARTFFKRRNIFTSVAIHQNHIKFKNERYHIVHTKISPSDLLSQTSFTHIILANGLYARHWNAFNQLPFNPVKGEVLTLHTDKTPPFILNKGVFCIPIAQGLCRVGATYEHQFSDDRPSEKGKEALVSKLSRVFNFKFDIVDHRAGIRPTTEDRKPFLGWSKNNTNVGIFSGFGSKGGSLIPYFADYWLRTDTSFGIGNEKIPKNIDIGRYNIGNS